MFDLKSLKILSISALTFSLRFFLLFATAKVSALFLGPSGLVVLGQWQNIVALGYALGGGALDTGVVRYSAQSRDDSQMVGSWIKAGAIISAGGALLFLLSTPLLFGQEQLAISIDPILVVLLLPLSVYVTSINGILLASLQGLQRAKEWSISMTLTSLFQLVLFYLLFSRVGESAVLPALLALPILKFPLILLFWSRSLDLTTIFSRGDTKKRVKQLSPYYGIGLVAAALPPLTMYINRTFLLIHASQLDAGLWQGAMKISDMVSMFVGGILGIWFIPHLSRISSRSELSGFLKRSVFAVAITGTIFASVGWLLRGWLYPFILSESFHPLTTTAHMQFTGDVLRSINWCFGMFLVVRGVLKPYLCIEIIGQIFLVCLTGIFVYSGGGFEGAVRAYLFESLFSFVANALYICFYFKSLKDIHHNLEER